MEKLRYFLGANSPTGFYGYFQKAYGADWKVWLIKGGPGTGKSTLLRRVTQTAGGEWEYIHCSSDPKSLDAVISTEKRVMIADATAPHTMDARYPGCVEQILDVGGGFDLTSLRQKREQVVTLMSANAVQHRRAVHYLAAAAQVQQVRQEQAEEKLREKELKTAAKKLCDTEWPVLGSVGRESLRGLSAVTPDGVLFYETTITALADRIYVLQDDWGAVSAAFLADLREELLARGYDVITSRCSLFPDKKLEHLILPQQRVAFVTSNAAHRFTAAIGQETDLTDFYKSQVGTEDELKHFQTLEKSLLNEASACMAKALAIHDELEQCYIHSMNFEFTQKKAEELGELLKESSAEI